MTTRKRKVCPVCKTELRSKRHEETHIFESGASAECHGYVFAGWSEWSEKSGSVRFPIEIDAIPEELLFPVGTRTRMRGSRLLYTVLKAARLYNELSTHWQATRTFAGTKHNSCPDVRLWMRRILLDEEASAIFLMILESGVSRGEALNRVADLFDLPKFWEMR